MTRVYIAGKVTGEPLDECRAKFKEAELKLKSAGFQVVNPMNIVPEGTDWKLAMKTCIKSLLTCDAVYLLPCWTTSEGALLELTIAVRVGINIIQNKGICTQG